MKKDPKYTRPDFRECGTLADVARVLAEQEGITPGTVWVSQEGEVLRIDSPLIPGDASGPVSLYVHQHTADLLTARGADPRKDLADPATLDAWMAANSCKVDVRWDIREWEHVTLNVSFLQPDGVTWGPGHADYADPFLGKNGGYSGGCRALRFPHIYGFARMTMGMAQAQGYVAAYLRGEDPLAVASIGMGAETPQTASLALYSDMAALDSARSGMADLAGRGEQVMGVAARSALLARREMEERMASLRATLEQAMGPLRRQVAIVMHQVGKVGTVLTAVSKYLGEGEEVLQVADGPRAPDRDPVHIYQRLLYADEEVGDPREQAGIRGLNHRNFATDFPAWLMEPSGDPWHQFNYQRLVPASKGVVAVQVSRQRGRYWDWREELEDLETYLVIRNGKALWVLWSGLNYAPRLYPDDGELARMWDAEKWEDMPDGSREKPRYEAMKNRYTMKGLVLQGLVDRAGLFTLPEGVRVLDPSTHGGHIVFVPENDTRALGDGKTWAMRKKELNATLARGHRVAVFETDNSPGRFSKVYQSDYGRPSPPKAGIYTLEQGTEDVVFQAYSTPREGRYPGRKEAEAALAKVIKDGRFEIEYGSLEGPWAQGAKISENGKRTRIHYNFK